MKNTQDHLGQAPSTEDEKRGKKALLIEDEPTQRKLAQVARTNAGFDVTSVADGMTALRHARPDVVLSDVLSSGFARRASLQAAQMSTLGLIADALARQVDPESALDETLTQCLDAAGLSVGAILLFGVGHRLLVRAEVGTVARCIWADHSEVLERAVDLGCLMIPSPSAGLLGDDLLSDAGTRAALVVPIVARDEAFGLLVLGSSHGDFSGTAGDALIGAVRSVSTQLGQALALSRLVSRAVAAEQRYRLLFDSARDAISILDPEGTILEMNQRWEEIAGVSRCEMVGRHIAEFAPSGVGGVAGEDGDAAETGAAAVGCTCESISPTPIRTHDGSIIQMEFSKTVVVVAGRKLVLAIGRDVSDRLRLSEQLRQAQKLEAIGRLAGGVAHDMNNILGVVLTYSQFLEESLQPEDPRRQDAIEIGLAAERGAGLTRQLLAFSRQQVVEMRILDLNGVIRGMTRMVRTLMREGVRLETQLAEDLPTVRADSGGLEQVIMNLAVNARDAIPGNGRLTIATGVDGDRVLMRVSDNGVGMDSIALQRLFEPFFTTKATGKGTGLGLSTVFGIVKQSGGDIEVDSRLGYGTTFRIYLPIALGEGSSRPPLPAPTPLTGGHETVVVVEDEVALRDALVRLLTDLGYAVISAATGASTLEACVAHGGSVHLLVTDVVLPSLSGPEVARRLRMDHPRLKVLFMSGYTDTTAHPSVPVGGLGFLQKPFTPRTLAVRVRELLDTAP